ncbi:MAG: cell division protein ZapA [Prevotella sp.]|nr:cell division protein ZapA [Prevotella sp.]MCM1075346.1 cell division protein ZapA [Ruminococcus sp.]
MKDTDKIKMRIKIAGMSIPLTVGFDEQDHVRETERRVAELFDNWRRMFPSKSEQELLAMMTYQYASYYLALSKSREQIARQLSDFDKQVSDLIVRT